MRFFPRKKHSLREQEKEKRATTFWKVGKQAGTDLAVPRKLNSKAVMKSYEATIKGSNLGTRNFWK